MPVRPLRAAGLAGMRAHDARRARAALLPDSSRLLRLPERQLARAARLAQALAAGIPVGARAHRPGLHAVLGGRSCGLIRHGSCCCRLGLRCHRLEQWEAGPTAAPVPVGAQGRQRPGLCSRQGWLRLLLLDSAGQRAGLRLPGPRAQPRTPRHMGRLRVRQDRGLQASGRELLCGTCSGSCVQPACTQGALHRRAVSHAHCAGVGCAGHRPDGTRLALVLTCTVRTVLP